MDNAIRLLVPSEPLRDPVLITAFQGRGSLTPVLVASLFDRYEPEPIAEVDVDPFYDFTVARPLVRLVDGERTLQWPTVQFVRVALEDRDLVVLSAIEPNIAWRRIADAVRAVSEAFGIHEVVQLSSFGGGTPHTRPIPVQWLAVSAEVPQRFGQTPRRPRYEGPATFSMALGTVLRDAGFEVGTLNAIAPFYLGVEPNPHAALALARALEHEFGVDFDLEDVERHVAEVELQAVEQLANTEHLRVFLADLEQQYDDMQDALAATGSTLSGSPEPVHALPDSDLVIADVEAMLREHRGPGSAGAEGSRQA